MKAILLALSVIGACFVLLTANASAVTISVRTWVSSTGSDASSDCGRTTPCQTFAGALPKTMQGGEIDCIDSSDFNFNGTLTITQSVTIKCDNVEAGMEYLSDGIDINAGPNDVIYLSGLHLDGSINGQNGIKFMNGAELHVKNCVISGSGGGVGPDRNGIFFNNSSNAKLFVSDTLIRDNSWTGIQVNPVGGANASVMISRVRSERNGTGFFAYETGGGSIWMDIEDSTAASSVGSGVNATGPNAQVILNRVASSNNGRSGIVANSGGTVRFGYSTISGNTIGTQNNGGILGSYGNNLINGNVSDGATPPTIPMH